MAALTAWSRFRSGPGVCAVPLGGVAPSNASVADHSYPEAFRVTGLRLDSATTAEGRHRFALDPNGTLRRLAFDASGTCAGESGGGWTVKGGWRYSEHGGGLIARLGWFIGDPVDERIIDIPDAEPQVAYLDGVAYMRDTSGSVDCG